MAGINNEYLNDHKVFRSRNRKIFVVFPVIAVLVAIIVFWALKLIGITITSDALCGLEEHIHGEECYSVVEVYSETTQACTDVSEEHTDTSEETTDISEAVYETTEVQTELVQVQTEKKLICTKPEHTHSPDCFHDKMVDTETESDWLSTMEGVEITDSVPKNLIAIAESQLGYEESQINFEYDALGNKNGYTRYGEWYGSPYGNWSAMFVSFCLHYSNVPQDKPVFSSSAVTMQMLWEQEGLYEAVEGHEAAVGELVFLDTDKDGVIDCVGIVGEITDEGTKMIIGDSNDRVEQVLIGENERVIGYGLTHKLNVEEKETAVEEITGEAAHSHTDDCYTSDDILVCTEWMKTEPWALDWESDEFKDTAPKYVSCLINQLPDKDVFESKLNEYDLNEDNDGYEAYYKEVYDLVCKAYVNYENLLVDLREAVNNRAHLFEYEWLYSGTSTMAVTETRTVQFVNYYDNATANKTVLIHSKRVGTYSSFGFYWWYAVVVDENEYGELVVTKKYGYELTNKSNLAPSTDNGFVLLSHGDSNVFDCEIGDEVTVNFDYLNTSGKSSTSFGTVTFSDYVPPDEPPTETPDDPDDPDVPAGDPVVEDIPVADIVDGELSDSQVKDAGGKTTSAEGDVEISKSIDGTDIENVFDITLTVRTESSMQTYLADPDMAVVIVMDISNTMNDKYPSGSSTSRYDAAVVAAENFINQLSQKARGISKLGFVAFNTNAHEILPLQTCTSANASALISEMKTDTANIINNYVTDDKTRFTNVEGGLKMGYDMLNASDNENKYIIFLSDGFPTTYLVNNSSNNTASFYEGYDPYTSSGTKGADGVFYDYVTGYYCQYGTSYSDKAAIKARVMATNIKNDGAKIFSIGIDIGGQTIAGFDGRTGLSVIDRTGTTYEIGDASSTSAYQNWLKNSIGSGYYYDSNNQSEITAAFNQIFAEIESLNKESRETIWTTTDPLPVLGENAHVIEFINFYDKDGNPVYDVDETEGFKYISGEFGVNLENTAFYKDDTIYWDLKDSGYETYTSEDENTTYFFYKIVYRVRLCNELECFVEHSDYDTNGDAFLEYKTITSNGTETTVSDNKKLYFEKPAVEGYYSDFNFLKKSDLGDPLAGAEFTLLHDDTACSVCHGDGKPVDTVSTLGPYTSAEDGFVLLSRIPSGHTYILEETKIPDGYLGTERIYKVTVALDELSIRIYDFEEDTVGSLWAGDEEFVFINRSTVYIFPETGGSGTLHLTIIGLALMATPILYSSIRRKRERRFS